MLGSIRRALRALLSLALIASLSAPSTARASDLPFTLVTLGKLKPIHYCCSKAHAVHGGGPPGKADHSEPGFSGGIIMVGLGSVTLVMGVPLFAVGAANALPDPSRNQPAETAGLVLMIVGGTVAILGGVLMALNNDPPAPEPAIPAKPSVLTMIHRASQGGDPFVRVPEMPAHAMGTTIDATLDAKSATVPVFTVTF